jgi:hypothetical protein
MRHRRPAPAQRVTRVERREEIVWSTSPQRMASATPTSRAAAAHSLRSCQGAGMTPPPRAQWTAHRAGPGIAPRPRAPPPRERAVLPIAASSRSRAAFAEGVQRSRGARHGPRRLDEHEVGALPPDGERDDLARWHGARTCFPRRPRIGTAIVQPSNALKAGLRGAMRPLSPECERPRVGPPAHLLRRTSRRAGQERCCPVRLSHISAAAQTGPFPGD